MNRSVLAAAGVLVGLLAFAGPAAAGSVRLETIRQHGSTAKRVVYEGDAGADYVTIALARIEDLKDDSSAPRTLIGFLVTDLGPGSPGPGCSATHRPSVYLCRVSSGTRLLAPRMYGRGGADTLEVDVPRPGGLVVGGTGSDELWGPYEDDGETQVPIELHGGPGSDRLEATGRLYGGPGDDRFEMSSGASRLIGGAGDDQIWGSPRGDFIDAGPGRDAVYADTGNDVVLARDEHGPGDQFLFGCAGFVPIFVLHGSTSADGSVGVHRAATPTSSRATRAAIDSSRTAATKATTSASDRLPTARRSRGVASHSCHCGSSTTGGTSAT